MSRAGGAEASELYRMCVRTVSGVSAGSRGVGAEASRGWRVPGQWVVAVAAAVTQAGWGRPDPALTSPVAKRKPGSYGRGWQPLRT